MRARWSQLPIEQLVPGDIVVLEQGDHISADCRLIEAFGVRVDNAIITGESLPQVREAGSCTRATSCSTPGTYCSPARRWCPGRGRAVVFATGMQTEFGKIAYLTQAAGEAVSPLRAEIEHLSRWIGILAVLIGVLFFVVGRFSGVPFWNAFIFAIGIIVAMVPEGLLPTLTLALVLATQRMARRNVLIRRLPSIGTLGSTTVICTDKTGTLTQNRMVVRQIFLGAPLSGRRRGERGAGLAGALRPFFLVARLCHDLKETEQEARRPFSGIPWRSRSSRWRRRPCLPASPVIQRVDEVPFDADRMRMSTVHTLRDGPPCVARERPRPRCFFLPGTCSSMARFGLLPQTRR